jgi:hypothetical protein
MEAFLVIRTARSGFEADKQETSFRLLLDVKDIPGLAALQYNALFRINHGDAHSGIIPHTSPSST